MTEVFRFLRQIQVAEIADGGMRGINGGRPEFPVLLWITALEMGAVLDLAKIQEMAQEMAQEIQVAQVVQIPVAASAVHSRRHFNPGTL
jgi:hypothetical protein